MYEYHVTFSGSKKIIKLENKEDIESSIREAFQIDRNSAITLQMYDKEWEDFVNVEDELPDRAKLQVILSFPITVESAQVTATIPVVESTPAPAESLDASIPSTSKDATQVESVGGTAVKDDSAPVTTGSGKPIPLTYSLPSDGISAALRRKLQSKERLSSKERSELLAALYNDVTTSYKFYLDPNEYDILARSLLRDYPHLSEGINHRDAVVSWHRKVKDKFKNTRKRADRGQPDVKKRLAIYPRGAESGKANRNVWGLPNFLPNRSAADDNHTIEGFKKELQMQSKYKDEKRDQERINRRMDATFPDRRVDVVVKALPIREIKSSYPILFSEKEISREFSRLADIKLTVFNEGVQRYAHRIVQLQTKNKVPDLAQRLKEKAQECETEAERNDAICMQAVLQVPTLLNENISALFKAQENEDHATPYILALNPMSSGAVFKIIAEGEEVCSTTNLLKAFRLLVATFYVFNYVYPKCATSTLTFFQKVFLNLQDESRPNHKVINLMKKVAVSSSEK